MEDLLSNTVLGLCHRGRLRARRRAGWSSRTPPPGSSTSPTAPSACWARSPTGSSRRLGVAGPGRARRGAPGRGTAHSGLLIERRDHARPHDAPETVRIVVTVSLLVALLGLGHVDLAAQEVYRVPLLFPRQAGHDLRRQRHVAQPHRVLRGRRRWPSASGCCLPHPRPASTCAPRSTAGRSPCSTARGPHRSAAHRLGHRLLLAALAGILIGPLRGQLSHTNLTLLIVSAYAAAMIGRLRSLPMTFVGAVFLGLADSYAIGYLPSGNAYLTTFRFVIPVVVLFVVLLVLPNPQLRTRATTTSREEIATAVVAGGAHHGGGRDRRRRPSCSRHPRRRRRPPRVTCVRRRRSSRCRSCRSPASADRCRCAR